MGETVLVLNEDTAVRFNGNIKKKKTFNIKINVVVNERGREREKRKRELCIKMRDVMWKMTKIL